MEVKTDGVTRTVVLVGRHAIKVPSLTNGWQMFLTGLLCNMQERAWSGYSDKLCPVVFSAWGGWLNVMPRAQPLTDREWEALDYEEFRTGPDGTRLPVEQKPCSFGKLNGRIVAVDYG